MAAPEVRTSFAIIAALGFTQIVGYGTLYYSFSILAPDMARDLGITKEEVFSVFSVALLAGGLTAPVIGLWMDRFGAARTMVAGSALSALVLAICAWSSATPFFVGGVVAMQVVAGLALYQAAFATLVERSPQTATRNITSLTLIAGFASTIFWPITTMMAANMDWRQVYFIFAGLNLVTCLPVHAILARRRPDVTGGFSAAPIRPQITGILTPENRKRAMTLVSGAFALSGFALSSVLTHMVPMLGGLGLGTAAVTIGSLFGPAQVISRVASMIFGERLPPTGLAILSVSLVATGGLVLALSGGSFAGAMVFALATGLGSGIGSIAQGSLPLYLFGSQGYGAITGRITAARLVAAAAAPALFAVAMERIGIPNALLLNSGLGALGIAFFWFVARTARP